MHKRKILSPVKNYFHKFIFSPIGKEKKLDPPWSMFYIHYKPITRFNTIIFEQNFHLIFPFSKEKSDENFVHK